MKWKKKWDIDKNGSPDIEADIETEKDGIIIRIKAVSPLMKVIVSIVILAAGWVLGHFGGLW